MFCLLKCLDIILIEQHFAYEQIRVIIKFVLYYLTFSENMNKLLVYYKNIICFFFLSNYHIINVPTNRSKNYRDKDEF